MKLINPKITAFCSLLLVAVPQGLAQKSIAIVGSGSNLPNPLYGAWTEVYNKRNPLIQVRYMPMGTAEGIRQITSGIGDFGAGEVPISDDQLRSAKVRLIHLPTVLVGIVPIYNLPTVSKELKFSGSVLAELFMGRIKSWNDPRIAKLNPGVTLPSLPVKIVHRSDGKGSNYIFSDFLSKVSPEFQEKVGRSASPKWPEGSMSANRGEDMVKTVQSGSGSIGYVELGYAVKSGLGIGLVQNASGDFVSASPRSIAAALKDHAIPADFRVSITNPAAKDAYPISSFTWLYVPAGNLSPDRIHAMKNFLNWALTTGQEQAQSRGYTPLPESLVTKVQAKVDSLQ